MSSQKPMHVHEVVERFVAGCHAAQQMAIRCGHHSHDFNMLANRGVDDAEMTKRWREIADGHRQTIIDAASHLYEAMNLLGDAHNASDSCDEFQEDVTNPAFDGLREILGKGD